MSNSLLTKQKRLFPLWHYVSCVECCMNVCFIPYKKTKKKKLNNQCNINAVLHNIVSFCLKQTINLIFGIELKICKQFDFLFVTELRTIIVLQASYYWFFEMLVSFHYTLLVECSKFTIFVRLISVYIPRKKNPSETRFLLAIFFAAKNFSV